MKRRVFLSLGLAPLASLAGNVEPIRFPRDHGAHPGFRTEWWYVTGWLGERTGFQVTFFRVRQEGQEGNPSAFAPRQVLLAHAALAEPSRGRLVHEERAARAGLGLAGAELSRAEVWIDDWRFEQAGERYRIRIPGRELDFDLALTPRRTVLQGDDGISRKGLRPGETSHYYSQPHLAVEGTLNGARATGEAWLDHEWSDAYLPPEASGWDWTGINLADGGSLMAFRMRAKAGGVHFAPPGVSFTPLRTWRSPRTGIEYPVAMLVEKDGKILTLEPLMDDQEFDARASTGIIYWEGAVRALEGGREAGRGYLELTGYGGPMKL